jgi:hypothetical protein
MRIVSITADDGGGSQPTSHVCVQEGEVRSRQLVETGPVAGLGSAHILGMLKGSSTEVLSYGEIASALVDDAGGDAMTLGETGHWNGSPVSTSFA